LKKEEKRKGWMDHGGGKKKRKSGGPSFYSHEPVAWKKKKGEKIDEKSFIFSSLSPNRGKK